MPIQRRYLLYTDKYLADPVLSKTAYALLRFCPSAVMGILDNGHSFNKCSYEIKQIIETQKIPIFEDIYSINNLSELETVIGFAPTGGQFEKNQMSIINYLLTQGTPIINGLHTIINHPLVRNLRHEPYEELIASYKSYKSKIILTVGTDHSIGKMTSSVLINNALRSKGIDIDWLPTGQTGKLLRGNGHVLDSIPIDFVPGVLQKDIDDYNNEFLIIEGQGSIFFPAYSPTSMALFHTSRPEYIIICHELNRMHGCFGNKLHSIGESKNIYEKLALLLDFETKTIMITVNSSNVSWDEYLVEKQKIEDETGVLCADPLRDDMNTVCDRLIKVL